VISRIEDHVPVEPPDLVLMSYSLDGIPDERLGATMTTLGLVPRAPREGHLRDSRPGALTARAALEYQARLAGMARIVGGIVSIDVESAGLWRSDRYRAELLGEKRGAVLSLDEIRRVGDEFYEDPEGLQLYGMRPRDYFEIGVRVTGRTAIECSNDVRAIGQAEAVRDVLSREFPGRSPSALDLFTGSGNSLYHLARSTSAVTAVGFELDDNVYQLTRKNFEKVGFQAHFERGSYKDLLRPEVLPRDTPCAVLVSPPWGAAFSFTGGLDLRRTEPPVGEILSFVRERLPHHELIFVIQTHERTVAASVAAITAGRAVYAEGVIHASARPERNQAYIVCSA
jgi:hypothetical protein